MKIEKELKGTDSTNNLSTRQLVYLSTQLIKHILEFFPE